MTPRKQIWAARSATRTAWAEAAEANAASLLANQNTDWAFISQPGHIPARAAQIARTDRAMELLDKAKAHREKAANLASLAERNKGDAEKARQAARDSLDIVAGDNAVDVIFGQCVVVKVNAKSVRVRLASGSLMTRDKSYLKWAACTPPAHLK
jgi:hypothetical protein